MIIDHDVPTIIINKQTILNKPTSKLTLFKK